MAFRAGRPGQAAESIELVSGSCEGASSGPPVLAPANRRATHLPTEMMSARSLSLVSWSHADRQVAGRGSGWGQKPDLHESAIEVRMGSRSCLCGGSAVHNSRAPRTVRLGLTMPPVD